MPDGAVALATPRLAEHFESLEKQTHAARLGMWVFLATEILLFTGLFVAYAYYRIVFPDTFKLGAEHLQLWAGTVNTLVLVTSSLAVAMAGHFVHHGGRKLATASLGAGIFLGLVFLAIKGVEWTTHLREGALPGSHYHYADMSAPGSSLFFSLYFTMTGLHALHVTVGLGVLVWLAIGAARGAYSSAYDTPLELGGMYWHLVDVVWVFLYPLLYLV